MIWRDSFDQQFDPVGDRSCSLSKNIEEAMFYSVHRLKAHCPSPRQLQSNGRLIQIWIHEYRQTNAKVWNVSPKCLLILTVYLPAVLYKAAVATVSTRSFLRASETLRRQATSRLPKELEAMLLQ